MYGLIGKGMEMAEDNGKDNDQGKGQRRREQIGIKKIESKRRYAKEATLTVDMGEVSDGRAVDLIKVIAEKVGVDKILAVRPKQNRLYEVTLTNEEICDDLVDGLEMKGEKCEVKKLQEREYVVSFMHLPAYLEDSNITDKLEGWGVTPTSGIRRRYYSGTEIEDGTRFVRVKFPKEVVSLPYSTRFETAEGTQHFRIIHNRQVKTCRLCMNPEHILKDCPEFRCYKCEQQGHFARDCREVKCPDCLEFLDKCQCWTGSEGEQEEEQREVGGQMQDEMAETQMEEQQEATAENTESNRDDKQSSECGGEEEAEKMEEGTRTSVVEVGHKRTEQIEVENRKRDSESEEDSDTCEWRKRQKAEKKG
ncbi:hypothetical protein M9458_052943 [Cirrhinus mrigala]|uniref:CCHC-type domain-containing protein n=1 Tax=Cirrhinus mrigala TaxID=683832 RepID=A0ABD0MRN2_CIRMR